MSNGLAPCPTFKLFTPPSSVLWCISLQSCNYCRHCNVASGIWHSNVVPMIVLGDMRKGRVISNSGDQHMQAKSDLCDLKLSQLCCWQCESSGIWPYIIQYVGLYISRALHCFKTSSHTHLASWRHIPEKLLLQTWLGPMTHVMLKWDKFLSDFSLPW